MAAQSNLVTIKDSDLTIVSAFEAVGQYIAHNIDEKELLEVERHACPWCGLLWRHVYR